MTTKQKRHSNHTILRQLPKAGLLPLDEISPNPDNARKHKLPRFAHFSPTV